MSNTTDDLRTILFDTMRAVRNGKCDIATAKAVSDLGQTVINTVKAETEFARATGQVVASNLIGAPITRTPTAHGVKEIEGNITRHRMS